MNYLKKEWVVNDHPLIEHFGYFRLSKSFWTNIFKVHLNNTAVVAFQGFHIAKCLCPLQYAKAHALFWDGQILFWVLGQYQEVTTWEAALMKLTGRMLEAWAKTEGHRAMIGLNQFLSEYRKAGFHLRCPFQIGVNGDKTTFSKRGEEGLHCLLQVGCLAEISGNLTVDFALVVLPERVAFIQGSGFFVSFNDSFGIGFAFLNIGLIKSIDACGSTKDGSSVFPKIKLFGQVIDIGQMHANNRVPSLTQRCQTIFPFVIYTHVHKNTILSIFFRT